MTYERFDEALVGSINVEDITPNEQNQKILQCLRDDDPILDNEPFHKMWIVDRDGTDDDRRDYIPDVGDGWGSDEEDIGWLGYFLGKNTSLMELTMCSGIDYTDTFYKGLNRNKTIRKILLCGMDGEKLKMLDQFFKNNDSLRDFAVEASEFNEAGTRQLALAFGNCNKSLKRIDISYCDTIEGGRMVDIIIALSMHPQLETLELCDMIIRRNEWTALSTLLRCTTTQLNKLDLQNINIDDDGVEDLVNALSNGNKLEWLVLSRNESITIKGWKKVSTLLEIPGCELEKMHVDGNNMETKGQ